MQHVTGHSTNYDKDDNHLNFLGNQIPLQMFHVLVLSIHDDLGQVTG